LVARVAFLTLWTTVTLFSHHTGPPLQPGPSLRTLIARVARRANQASRTAEAKASGLTRQHLNCGSDGSSKRAHESPLHFTQLRHLALE